MIEQGGDVIAALVSPADLARLEWFEQEAERQAAEDWAAIDRLRERNRDADPDDVLRDATEAVEEVRREIYEEERRDPATPSVDPVLAVHEAAPTDAEPLSEHERAALAAWRRTPGQTIPAAEAKRRLLGGDEAGEAGAG